jgi:hypothetical protein
MALSFESAAVVFIFFSREYHVFRIMLEHSDQSQATKPLRILITSLLPLLLASVSSRVCYLKDPFCCLPTQLNMFSTSSHRVLRLCDLALKLGIAEIGSSTCALILDFLSSLSSGVKLLGLFEMGLQLMSLF